MTVKDYVNEGKLLNWMKAIGLSIKDLYIERPQCKNQRNKSSFIFLFHGTRPQYVSDIKRKGLLLDKAGKRTEDEGDFSLTGKQKLIWFSSTYDPNSHQFGRDKKTEVVMMIAKLETKYLKNYLGATYTYHKDVPPKNLIWEENSAFQKISQASKCLRNR